MTCFVVWSTYRMPMPRRIAEPLVPSSWCGRSDARMADGAKGANTQEGRFLSSNQAGPRADGTPFEPCASSTGGARTPSHLGRELPHSTPATSWALAQASVLIWCEFSGHAGNMFGRRRRFTPSVVATGGYSGMLPCFFAGSDSRLFRSMSRARMSRGRVSRGSITSSTKPFSAAMYGLLNFSS